MQESEPMQAAHRIKAWDLWRYDASPIPTSIASNLLEPGVFGDGLYFDLCNNHEELGRLVKERRHQRDGFVPLLCPVIKREIDFALWKNGYAASCSWELHINRSHYSARPCRMCWKAFSCGRRSNHYCDICLNRYDPAAPTTPCEELDEYARREVEAMQAAYRPPDLVVCGSVLMSIYCHSYHRTHIHELTYGMCAYCNSREADTVDHLVPLVRGGMHVPDNLVASCQSCNSSKGVKSLEVFLDRGGRSPSPWRSLILSRHDRYRGKYDHMSGGAAAIAFRHEYMHRSNTRALSICQYAPDGYYKYLYDKRVSSAERRRDRLSELRVGDCVRVVRQRDGRCVVKKHPSGRKAFSVHARELKCI